MQRQTAAGLCAHQCFVDVLPPPCTERGGKADGLFPLYAGFHQLGTVLQPVKPNSNSRTIQAGRQRRFPDSLAPCCESEMQEENPTHEAMQRTGGKGDEEITATSHLCSSDPGILSSRSPFRKPYQAFYLAHLSLALPMMINGNKVVSP